jgi:hypothetical protein
MGIEPTNPCVQSVVGVIRRTSASEECWWAPWANDREHFKREADVPRKWRVGWRPAAIVALTDRHLV